MVETRVIKCPYCGEGTEVDKENIMDLHEVGKSCFCCAACDKIFVLRDDGDGEYIRGRATEVVSIPHR